MILALAVVALWAFAEAIFWFIVADVPISILAGRHGLAGGRHFMLGISRSCRVRVVRMSEDPDAIFETWLAKAKASEPNDPTAMALATVSADGQPSCRMVLCKGHDARGFVWYTNFESCKAGELLATPRAALLFHWKSLRRQVRAEGPVSRVSDAEADAYFATRSRDSQLGAWASDQSRPLSSRDVFEARFAETQARYEGGAVPRPPHWSGFLLAPERFELWEDGAHRLHHRRLFIRSGDSWSEGLLYP